jgi:hypothetical protein
MTADLHPCPFCNGEARHENFIVEAIVRCVHCGATITRRHAPEWDSGAPASIAAWNRRALPTSAPVDDRAEPKSASAGSEPSAPVRVQLSRAKGWRMPPNTVRVCRPTVYGNPFTIEDLGRHDAVEAFRRYVTGPLWEDPNVRADQMRLHARIPTLRGKNLACWRRLDRVCHADVLLELANAEPAKPTLGGPTDANDKGPGSAENPAVADHPSVLK